MQILKSDSSLYLESDKIQPSLVNNALFSLIKSASLFLNNIQIVNINENYAQKDIFETLINFSKESCKSRLISQGLFPPESVESRNKFYANSKLIHLKGKFNILNCDKFLIPGVDLLIKLVKHDEKFVLLESDDGAGKKTNSKLVLKDLKIEIRQIKTFADFVLSLETQLSRGHNIEYEFKSGEVTSYSLPTSTINFVTPSVILSTRPSFLLAAFINSGNYLGDKEKDSHLYTMSNLQEFSFIINGGTALRTAMTFKNTATEKKYADAFLNLFRSLDTQNENCNSLVNYENFPTNTFFLTFDCSSYNFALSNVQEPMVNSNIGFSCLFSIPLKEPLTVLLYALKNRSFSIDALRKISPIY